MVNLHDTLTHTRTTNKKRVNDYLVTCLVTWIGVLPALFKNIVLLLLYLITSLYKKTFHRTTTKKNITTAGSKKSLCLLMSFSVSTPEGKTFIKRNNI